MIRPALIRSAPLLTLPAVLAEYGADARAVFARAGMPYSVLDDPETLVPYATAAAVFAQAVTASGCPHVGLLAGHRSGPEVLGRLGFLMLSAPDVATALDDLIAYFRRHDQGGSPRLRTEQEIAWLGYEVVDPATYGADQAADCAIAIGANLLRGLCGPDWRPSEVTLTRRRPPDAAIYARVFRAPVTFSAEENALVFPARDLDRPTPQRQPVLHDLLTRDLRGESAGEDDSLETVRHGLRARLGTGSCSVDAAAAMFGLSARAFQRRLTELGTTFLVLLEEVRRTEAQRLLLHTDLPLTEVALRLGYSDPSAFVRAFRRWEGVPPAQWRAARTRRAASSELLPLSA